MSNFSIILPAEFLNEEELTLALKSFADFYNNLTTKHQKKIFLLIISHPEYVNFNEQKIKELNLKNAAMVFSADAEKEVTTVLNDASILFYPTIKVSKKVIKYGLLNGMTILAYDNYKSKEWLDNTCAQLIESSSDSMARDQFSSTLRLLFFDPEGLKLLKTAAIRKYEELYTWKNLSKDRIA